MKAIVYTRPDGGLSVCRPAEGARLAFFITLNDGTRLPTSPFTARAVDSVKRGWPVTGAVVEWAESEDEFISRILKKDIPADATNVQVVGESAIPSDRTFRNAWKAGSGLVEYDMEKCRELHRANLRDLRKPKFAALDVAWMKAISAGDTAGASAVEAKRQLLRDVTQYALIDKATTPAELKIAIPAILGSSG